MAPKLTILPDAKPSSVARAAGGDLDYLRGQLDAFSNSLEDASRLTTIGMTLIDGAIDLRRSSGTDVDIALAVRTWVSSHVEEISRAKAKGASQYRKVSDLKDAVIECGTEVDDAAKATGAYAVANSLYDTVERIISQRPIDVVGEIVQRDATSAVSTFQAGCDAIGISTGFGKGLLTGAVVGIIVGLGYALWQRKK
jgi:hypothetical protein